jgi:hypothetical protein
MHNLFHSLAKMVGEFLQTKSNLIEAIQQSILGEVLEHRCLASQTGGQIVTYSAGELHVCSMQPPDWKSVINGRPMLIDADLLGFQTHNIGSSIV